MKNIKKILFLSLLFTFFCSALFAQAFVDKGFHPRLTALGRSVTALKGDAGLLFYNPSAISFSQTTQVFAGFTNLYPSVVDDKLNVLSAGATFTLNEIGSVGVGVSQFSPNFWTERTIIFSFASQMLYENLSLGGSVKVLSWEAESPQGENAVPEPAFSYGGVSFDIGLLFVLPEMMDKNDLQAGLSISNLTQPSISSNGTANARLPMEISCGVAFLSQKYNYTVLVGAVVKEDDIKITAGYEISALKASSMGINGEFIVRFGGGRIASDESQGEYNVGFGINIDKIRIDYSYSYQAFIRNVGGISSVAINYEF